jgi:hypothetical protein
MRVRPTAKDLLGLVKDLDLDYAANRQLVGSDHCVAFAIIFCSRSCLTGWTTQCPAAKLTSGLTIFNSAIMSASIRCSACSV